MSNLHRVRAILERHGVQYALIGAWALGLRGYVRFTSDVDFLTTDKRVLNRDLWTELLDEGIPVDARKGDQFDPLGGVVHIGHTVDEVDVVVGKWKFEQRVIERAEPMEFEGVIVPVPTRGDLILLKLAAGGFQDVADVEQLLTRGPRVELVAHVNGEIETLPREAQELWRQLTPP